VSQSSIRQRPECVVAGGERERKRGVTVMAKI
jgi:hypothetical protein